MNATKRDFQVRFLEIDRTSRTRLASSVWTFYVRLNDSDQPSHSTQNLEIYSISSILSIHSDQRSLESVCHGERRIPAWQRGRRTKMQIPTDQRQAEWMDNNFIKEIKCKRGDERPDIARCPVSVGRGRAYMLTTSTRSSGQRGSEIYVLNIIYIYFIVFFTVFCRWYMACEWSPVCLCARAIAVQLHFCGACTIGCVGHSDDEMVTIKQNSFHFECWEMRIHLLYSFHSKHCWMRGNKFARISRTSSSSEACLR